VGPSQQPLLFEQTAPGQPPQTELQVQAGVEMAVVAFVIASDTVLEEEGDVVVVLWTAVDRVLGALAGRCADVAADDGGVVVAIATGEVVGASADLAEDVDGSSWNVGLPRVVFGIAERMGVELGASVGGAL
jgi:hypothetical protein